MMKIRKVLAHTIILALLIITLDKCYASVGINVGVDFGDGTKQEFDEEGNPIRTVPDSKWYNQSETEVNYTCKYSYKFNFDHESSIDIINKEGVSIVEEKRNETTGINEIFFLESVLAGTSVGVEIKETKRINWSVETVSVTGTKKEFRCNACKRTITDTKNCHVAFDGVETCPQTTTSCQCGSTGCDTANHCTSWKETEVNVTTIPEHIKKACKQRGENDLLSKANQNRHSSYIVKLRNPNYIDAGTQKENEDRIVKELSAGSCPEAGSGSHSLTCVYYYSVGATCMDATTGKVRYVTGSDKCIENKEIEIKPSNNVWQYFVPLDARTSTNEFGISLVYAGQIEKQEVDYCEKVIELKDNYWDYIKDVHNEQLPINDKRSAKEIVNNQEGCKLDTEVKFKIEQRFYNETDDDKKIKGFNFYYKPIPTNLSTVTNVADKVFPNGITDDSLWKDWYDKTKKDEEVYPNLKNKASTYIAKIFGNVDKIRERNKSTSYMSWSDMFADGHSGFVADTDLFDIASDVKYYKLGCGPANINVKNSDGTINNLHQGWCNSE